MCLQSSCCRRQIWLVSLPSYQASLLERPAMDLLQGSLAAIDGVDRRSAVRGKFLQNAQVLPPPLIRVRLLLGSWLCKVFIHVEASECLCFVM